MKKKVLIIGYGSISKKLIKVLRPHKNLNIAILRTNIKKKEKNGFNFFLHLEEAIKFRPNYVFICCPANSHSYYFEKFKKFDNNIFIEKPLLFRPNDIQIFKNYNFNFVVGYFKISSCCYLFKEIYQKKFV